MDNSDADLAADVERFGWVVMKVSNDGGPDFAYSIGLFRTFGHAELIMFGLRPDTMHRIINDIGESIRRGVPVRAGAVSGEFLEGYDVTFRAVPKYQYAGHFGWGLSYYGAEEFPALQVIYPDRHGRWPWQDGVVEEFRQIQPVLADMPEPPWATRPGE
jgi:hypothetical protein